MTSIEEKKETYKQKINDLNKQLEGESEPELNRNKIVVVLKESMVEELFYNFEEKRISHCPDCGSDIFRMYRLEVEYSYDFINQQICAKCNSNLRKPYSHVRFDKDGPRRRFFDPETGYEYWKGIPMELLTRMH
jgi:uncharacterized protein with PIN domain